MGNIRRCKWCGREYDDWKSTASGGNRSYYCSGRCEAEANRAKAEAEKAKAEARAQSGGSDNDGCVWKILTSKVFWIVVVVFIVVDMCSDPKEKGEAEENNVENTETTSYIDTESNAWWHLS